MFLLKWKYPGYFIMYKDVTGLAGKVIALVIGISLFFSKMFSSWLLKTQCFQLTECQPWILVMFLEQKWAQSGAEDDSCPHCVLLQACIELPNNSFTSLQHITQGPDGVFPNSAQLHKYSFGGAGKALRWPFFSPALWHPCSGEWSFTRSGRKNRTIGKGS